MHRVGAVSDAARIVPYARFTALTSRLAETSELVGIIQTGSAATSITNEMSLLTFKTSSVLCVLSDEQGYIPVGLDVC